MQHGSLSEIEIEQLLEQEQIGRLACLDDNNQPYMVPMNYVFESNSLYCHSFPGFKITFMRKNPLVCFEVEHVRSLADWKSAVVWGRYEELTGDEKERAWSILSSRLTPELKAAHGARHSQSLGQENEAVFFRIVIERRTGRYESPDPVSPRREADDKVSHHA